MINVHKLTDEELKADGKAPDGSDDDSEEDEE